MSSKPIAWATCTILLAAPVRAQSTVRTQQPAVRDLGLSVDSGIALHVLGVQLEDSGPGRPLRAWSLCAEADVPLENPASALRLALVVSDLGGAAPDRRFAVAESERDGVLLATPHAPTALEVCWQQGAQIVSRTFDRARRAWAGDATEITAGTVRLVAGTTTASGTHVVAWVTGAPGQTQELVLGWRGVDDRSWQAGTPVFADATQINGVAATSRGEHIALRVIAGRPASLWRLHARAARGEPTPHATQVATPGGVFGDSVAVSDAPSAKCEFTLFVDPSWTLWLGVDQIGAHAARPLGAIGPESRFALGADELGSFGAWTTDGSLWTARGVGADLAPTERRRLRGSVQDLACAVLAPHGPACVVLAASERSAEPTAMSSGTAEPSWRPVFPRSVSESSVQPRATNESDRRTAGAVARGLGWLARHQDADGAWDADDFMRHDGTDEPCDGAGNPVHDIGLTGLALLALVRNGSSLRAGPHRDAVKAAVVWLREQQDPDTGLFGTNAASNFIYDHAIATCAMIEACRESNSRLLRRNAQLAIHYLERHRNPYSVWRYQPRDNDNDTAVTGWCVAAYAAARDHGLEVNRTALQLADAWFDQMTDPTSGRCGYTERGSRPARRTARGATSSTMRLIENRRNGRREWRQVSDGEHGVKYPREKSESTTAVALLSRLLLGQTAETNRLVGMHANLLLRSPPRWDPNGGSIDLYYWFHATRALEWLDGRHWRHWSRHLVEALVEPQRRDGNYRGSWDPIGVWGEDGGRVYATAMACLTLTRRP